MNERLENKIDELYSLLMDKPLKILDIFNDFFGENRVDMQRFTDFDTFKTQLLETEVSRFISPNMLNISTDFFITNYGDKLLKELTGENLDKIIEVLCCKEVINYATSLLRLSGFILVHFPHVRITNEYNRYVDINHLYAKIPLNLNGSCDGIFGLNRAEYTYLHISNDYMHSHVSHIPFSDFSKFQVPCTGTGPINDTLLSLARKFNEDLWKLFCLELDKYVQVESIAGTPYHKLEHIGTSNMNSEASIFAIVNTLEEQEYFNKNMAALFTAYLIKSRKLKFSYKLGSYSIGMTFTEFMVLISNEFISWYNQMFNAEIYTYTFDNLLKYRIIRKGIIAGDKIYYTRNNVEPNTYRRYIGAKICTFKDKDVCINITEIDGIDSVNMSIFLNSNIALYILTRILNVINYRYGKSEQRDQEGNRISEKVRYF